MMRLSTFPEDSWREWLALYDVDTTSVDTPVSVLLELYPEVKRYGPVASTVSSVAIRVHNFLSGVAEESKFLAFHSGYELRNFEFFSFLSLQNSNEQLLYGDVNFWRALLTVNGHLDSSMYDLGLWDRVQEFDVSIPSLVDVLPVNFYEASVYTALCFLLSEICLAWGYVDSLTPFQVELRSVFLGDTLETRLQDFRTVAKQVV